MAKLRETPISDVMTKNGKLRIDGRLVRDQAYRPLAETGCPLAQKAEAKWRPRSHPDGAPSPSEIRALDRTTFRSNVAPRCL